MVRRSKRIAARMSNYMSSSRGRKRFRSRGTQTSGKRLTAGNSVTAQYDARSVYKKRRMPRRKRRAWKKKVRIVRTIAEGDLGTNTIVFNRSHDYFNTTNANHCIAVIPLYSQASTDTTQYPFHNDLNLISQMFNTGADPTAALGQVMQKAAKVFFHSAVLDITVRNTSGIVATPSDGTTPPVLTAASQAVMEVDVYEISSGREWAADSGFGVINDLTRAFANGAANTLNLGGAGTGATIHLRGTTPWDFPQALGRYRIKIWKKTKYFVQNGGQFTFQIRDPKRRVTGFEKMQNATGANRPGWTRHVFMIAKLTPGLLVGNTVATTYGEALSIGCTRKYMLKVEGFNEDRDRHFSAAQ